jgi:voltage-gated potassium channel
MSTSANRLSRERWSLLITIRNSVAPLMDGLAFLWLALTVYELSRGLTPILERIVTIIWVLFAIHFFIEFILAPGKKVYLKHNWPTAISLVLPAFRVFRFLRFFRYLRSLRSLSLVKILSSINRGMRALSKNLTRKVSLYVLSLTVMVIFSGAAGILNFESGETYYIKGFGSALWWSAMMVTTMGTDYFPKSAEGRVLAFFLAVYGFAIFGYVAATLASYLISRVRKEEKKENLQSEIEQLRSEIIELREFIRGTEIK